MPSNKSALSIVKKYHPRVTKVIDAKEDARIEVTKRDCRSATPKAADSCALARAFEREYDGAIVSLSKAYLVKGKVAYRFNVPQSVSREIVSFDRHNDFAPGQYYLVAPSASSQLQPLNRKLKKQKPRKLYSRNPKSRIHRTTGIRAL